MALIHKTSFYQSDEMFAVTIAGRLGAQWAVNFAWFWEGRPLEVQSLLGSAVFCLQLKSESGPLTFLIECQVIA